MVAHRKILPTSGRNAYAPATLLRHKSLLDSNIGRQPHGKPREVTVDLVDDHDESSAEI
jgi:hypothetical protein